MQKTNGIKLKKEDITNENHEYAERLPVRPRAQKRGITLVQVVRSTNRERISEELHKRAPVREVTRKEEG